MARFACTLRRTPDDEQSYEIDRMLDAEQREQTNVVKLLLLGAAEAGKSTVLRQMRIVHKDAGMSQSLEDARYMIYSNINDLIHRLCVLLTLYPTDPDTDGAIAEPGLLDRLTSYDAVQRMLDAPHPDIVVPLLSDPKTQGWILRYGGAHGLGDNSLYLMTHITRLASHAFEATVDDYLNARSRTTGIHVTELKVDQRVFKVVDVGGQRSERRKWIHCFDDTLAILFVVSLADFDLVLQEESSVNRLTEARELFQTIMKTNALCSASVIVFFNKTDLFIEKLNRGVRLAEYFPDYQGGGDITSARMYISSMFTSVEQTGVPRTIYTHFTCATDTHSMGKVIANVEQTIINRILAAYGLG